MQLLFIFLLIVVPFLLLTLVGPWVSALKLTPSTRARVGLTFFFAFTGIGHFFRTEEMSQMMPASIPYRVEIIYLTGVFELLGAVGVWIPALTRLTGLCLIIMLVCLLPANIYSALTHVEFGGHRAGPVYLLARVPFQLFVIWWTYWATEQKWFNFRVSGPRHRLRPGEEMKKYLLGVVLLTLGFAPVRTESKSSRSSQLERRGNFSIISKRCVVNDSKDKQTSPQTLTIPWLERNF